MYYNYAMKTIIDYLNQPIHNYNSMQVTLKCAVRAINNVLFKIKMILFKVKGGPFEFVNID